MENSNKRKARGGDDRDRRTSKKSKGGNGGKWQTPHQKTKMFRGSGKIEPGDMGIWATCARGQEGRATSELKSMLEDCAQRFYGLDSDKKEGDDEAEGSLDDIESSIRKEVASMSKEQSETKLFSAVDIDIPCVLFFKTRSPINPVDFVYRICREVASDPTVRRLRYVNRLTPVSMIVKATEKGLEDLWKVVLRPHFELEEDKQKGTEEGKVVEEKMTHVAVRPTYAIRPTIRNHSTLSRDIVIEQVACAVSKEHQVNLTAPDKTIIVEICQNVCGMCVVENDWETLKRFNLAELYASHKISSSSRAKLLKGEASPELAKTDELTAFSTHVSIPDNLES